MAIMMLLFMPEMYLNKKKNTLIVIPSIALYTISLFGLRTQTPHWRYKIYESDDTPLFIGNIN
jgi:hypothetical protein